jgi:hypothetical protein
VFLNFFQYFYNQGANFISRICIVFATITLYRTKYLYYMKGSWLMLRNGVVISRVLDGMRWICFAGSFTPNLLLLSFYTIRGFYLGKDTNVRQQILYYITKMQISLNFNLSILQHRHTIFYSRFFGIWF